MTCRHTKDQDGHCGEMLCASYRSKCPRHFVASPGYGTAPCTAWEPRPDQPGELSNDYTIG